MQALARLEGADARSATLAQQAEILTHIGQAQQRAGELGLASETYRRALAIAHEQGNLATLANLYAQLGALAEAQTDWETAETEYWLRLLVLSEYITEAEGDSLLNDCLEIKRILIASLNTTKHIS